MRLFLSLLLFSQTRAMPAYHCSDSLMEARSGDAAEVGAMIDGETRSEDAATNGAMVNGGG